MSNEAALLRAIAADPKSGLARLVYADWLDERSDPRGEYVRLLCGAAGWAECPNRDSAVARLQGMRPALDADWLGAVQRGVPWRLLFEANAAPFTMGGYGE